MKLLVLGAFGLIIGSFVNAVVWRLHSGESITRGRSMCPNCKHQLRAPDLIPVVSWVGLRGRCRYCKKAYGSHYLLVEIATAGLFVTSGLILMTLGPVLFSLWLAILVLLLILGLYDAQWYELPNSVMHPALVLSALYFVLRFEATGGLIQLGVAIMAATIFYGMWWLSHGKLMGGADSKLVLLMGLILPPALLGVALALGFMLGGLGAAYLLYGKKKGLQDQMPFGPYLIAGLVAAQFLGPQALRLLGL